MMLGQCARENEVMDLLRSGCWPAACEPELRDHVAACSLCAQTVLLKSSFAEALAQAKDEVRPQDHGVLWWRAQLRRRNAAVQRVNRPIAGAQRFALLVNLLAAFALLASQWRHLDRLTAWFSEAPVFHPAALLAHDGPATGLEPDGPDSLRRRVRGSGWNHGLSRHRTIASMARLYFGSRLSTPWLGLGITWAAISLPRPSTCAFPASTAARTAATSPLMIIVM